MNDPIITTSPLDKTFKRVFKRFYINTFIIYTITNLENNKYYLGYSSNGEQWKDSHSIKLFSGEHPLTDLQNDYNHIRDRKLDPDK